MLTTLLRNSKSASPRALELRQTVVAYQISHVSAERVHSLPRLLPASNLAVATQNSVVGAALPLYLDPFLD